MLQDNFAGALMNKNCIFSNIAEGPTVAPDSLQTRHDVFYGWREQVSNQKRYDGLKGNLWPVLLYRVSREVIIAYSYVLYMW